MGLWGGRQRIEVMHVVFGRSPMPAGRERAEIAFGSRTVGGGSHMPAHPRRTAISSKRPLASDLSICDAWHTNTIKRGIDTDGL